MSEQSAMQKRRRIAGPEFDADASVAAAVLKHVTSLRDRLALACVSKVWRDAAATEGGVTDVVIEGELAKRLTDERFKRVMDVCGALTRLEVRDAPEDFQGLYFYGDEQVLATKFARLTTLILTGCRGLDGSTIVDFMIVASGRSSRQVGAMAEHLREKLKGAGVKGLSVEGAARADWVLIDGGDIIVHLFRPEVRDFYGLEKMWGEELAPPGEAAAGGSG